MCGPFVTFHTDSLKGFLMCKYLVSLFFSGNQGWSSSKAAYTHCLHVFWKPLPQLCRVHTGCWPACLCPSSSLAPWSLGSHRVRATRGDHPALCVLGVSVRQCGCNKTPRANSFNSRRPSSRFQRPWRLSQVSAGLFPMRAVERICSSLPPGSRGLG